MKESLLHKGFHLLLERDFFINRFTREELVDLFENHSVFDFLSTKSPSFKKFQIDLEKLSVEGAIDLMLDEPRLIRRPLLKIGNQIFVGDVKLSFVNNLELLP